jgi:hypothetical protein
MEEGFSIGKFVHMAQDIVNQLTQLTQFDELPKENIIVEQIVMYCHQVLMIWLESSQVKRSQPLLNLLRN